MCCPPACSLPLVSASATHSQHRDGGARRRRRAHALRRSACPLAHPLVEVRRAPCGFRRVPLTCRNSLADNAVTEVGAVAIADLLAHTPSLQHLRHGAARECTGASFTWTTDPQAERQLARRWRRCGAWLGGGSAHDAESARVRAKLKNARSPFSQLFRIAPQRVVRRDRRRRGHSTGKGSAGELDSVVTVVSARLVHTLPTGSS